MVQRWRLLLLGGYSQWVEKAPPAFRPFTSFLPLLPVFFFCFLYLLGVGQPLGRRVCLQFRSLLSTKNLFPTNRLDILSPPPKVRLWEGPVGKASTTGAQRPLTGGRARRSPPADLPVLLSSLPYQVRLSSLLMGFGFERRMS